MPNEDPSTTFHSGKR